ncbi:hypothetical protein ABZ357_37535, partial [Streptomyces sp. NPDC005917]
HAQHGGAPAPLPVRGTQETRPNPAEALPGIRPEDRPAVADHAGTPPVPRVGAVRGTMGKPQLPRRRAQEHIVPQLRGGPAPRQDNEAPACHDPGLMAAFQRGIGLAETQQHLESAQAEPTAAEPVGGPHGETLYTGLTGMGLANMGADDGSGVTRSGEGSGDMASSTSHATHADATHMDAEHMDATHMEATPMDPAHIEAAHTTPAHTTPAHTAPAHMSRAHGDPADPRPASRPQSHSPALRPVHTSEFTARPDGSAPAG